MFAEKSKEEEEPEEEERRRRRKKNSVGKTESADDIRSKRYKINNLKKLFYLLKAKTMTEGGCCTLLHFVRLL